MKIWDEKTSHGEILKKIWKHLDLGVLEREHPFHTPVFGTISPNGEPVLRVVVLRRFWRRNPRGLAFHSHVGAPKVLEIQNNPQVAWSFYHPQEKFQLRIKGTASVHTDDELADEQWLATGFFSRRCYVGAAPSQPSEKPTTGLPADLIQRQPTAEESEAGRQNFAVVFSTIDSIDCMELDVRGHRRSLFVWNETGELETRWLTP
jgi:pyridoxamine 5'-phosphate oxidase